MKIKELNEDVNIDFLRARILSKQGPRRVRTREGLSYVTDILIADDTGTTIFNIFGTQKANALKIGQVIKKGEKLGEVGEYEVNGNWTPHLHFQIIMDMLGYEGTFPGVARNNQRGIWKKLCPDPQMLLNYPNRKNNTLEIDTILEERERHIGKSLSISYREPLKIVRGFLQYLYDERGRQYLDAVNNVPHVGHSHPDVA